LYPVIFKDITFVYGSYNVLNNISLIFEVNKITALTGRSGSGKSTMLQMINGLLRPTAGYIEVFGSRIDYADLINTRRKIGYSVQGTSLFPHLTVHDNISLPGKITGKPDSEINVRMKELMNMMELPDDFKSKYPYQLSGGEQQRVGLCRAMLLNPPVMLLDEPFAALDSFTKKEILDKLLKIQSVEPRTIIIVTHDLNEAAYLSDKTVKIEKGKIVNA
jgi:osmoprotectant transport system ATP-binding protein